MNTSSQTQLKIIVERAVRPVRASTNCKRKMREELLAHVSGVFEEESAKLGDESLALERTQQRFGNPGELTAQLQESVPMGDGFERFWEGRPGQSTLRRTLRFACMFEAFVLFVGVITVVVGGLRHEWPREIYLAIVSSSFFIPQWSIGPVWLFAIAFIAHWMEKSMVNPIENWPRIGLIKSFTSAWAVRAVRVSLIVGGVSFALSLGIAIANWFMEPADWDSWPQFLGWVPFAGFAVATSVLCAWLFVQTSAERRRYHQEWANLAIE
jgi:hypothetical protein